VEPLEGERGARTVPHQPFEACTIVALDAYGGVDAESAIRPPSQHVGGGVMPEETPSAKGAEHPPLEGTACLLQVVSRQDVPILRREPGGLVESHLTRVLVYAEYAVHGENVKVIMRV